jgi:hypothetical protein
VPKLLDEVHDVTARRFTSPNQDGIALYLDNDIAESRLGLPRLAYLIG